MREEIGASNQGRNQQIIYFIFFSGGVKKVSWGHKFPITKAPHKDTRTQSMPKAPKRQASDLACCGEPHRWSHWLGSVLTYMLIRCETLVKESLKRQLLNQEMDSGKGCFR